MSCCWTQTPDGWSHPEPCSCVCHGSECPGGCHEFYGGSPCDCPCHMDGLVNLTPHPVAIYRNRAIEDGPDQVIPPSGTVARLATIELGTQLGEVCSYELVQYGHAHGLPPARPGVAYVVSLVVALAVHRDDLLAPFVEVRNTEGTMVGCRYLQKVV